MEKSDKKNVNKCEHAQRIKANAHRHKNKPNSSPLSLVPFRHAPLFLSRSLRKLRPLSEPKKVLYSCGGNKLWQNRARALLPSSRGCSYKTSTIVDVDILGGSARKTSFWRCKDFQTRLRQNLSTREEFFEWKMEKK